MSEIICPKCKTAFTVDEAGYAQILKQVHDKEFDKQLNERLKLVQDDKQKAIELEKQKISAAKDIEIQELKAKLDASNTQQQLAITKALSELQELTLKKDAEIQKLQAIIDANETNKQLALTQAVSKIEKQRDELENKLQNAQLDKQLSLKSIEDKYKTQIEDRDEQIERLKDLKVKLSTKMLGESLEQHCEIEFNRLRATAFPSAYFEKDNDASSGSKGDYIFKEFDQNGVEIISIMFEMKNENETTATKKKNEDFLKELDKDRNEKKCEYAILVSMLESDNELYNTGIVDVSHRYRLQINE